MKYRYCWVDATDEQLLDQMGQQGWRVVPGTLMTGVRRQAAGTGFHNMPETAMVVQAQILMEAVIE